MGKFDGADDALVKNKGMLGGVVPQPKRQVTVMNRHLNDAMWRLLENPIFFKRINIDVCPPIVYKKKNLGQKKISAKKSSNRHDLKGPV